MSCEGYVRIRSVYEVGFGRKKSRDESPLKFRDDHEFLAYLIEQEHMAEHCETVSFESPTSD